MNCTIKGFSLPCSINESHKWIDSIAGQIKSLKRYKFSKDNWRTIKVTDENGREWTLGQLDEEINNSKKVK